MSSYSGKCLIRLLCNPQLSNAIIQIKNVEWIIVAFKTYSEIGKTPESVIKLGFHLLYQNFSTYSRVPYEKNGYLVVEMAYTTISRDKLTLCLLVQLLSPDETI
jgi:hypothetical protein